MEKRKILTLCLYLFMFGTFFHGNTYKKAWRQSVNRILVSAFDTRHSQTLSETGAAEHTTGAAHGEGAGAHEATGKIFSITKTDKA
jgi:hypothetical protein